MNMCVAFIISGILCTFLIGIVFFSKLRINNHETKIYGYLIISNFIGLIIELLCNLSSTFLASPTFEVYLVVKLYLIYIIEFLLLFTIYIFAISLKNYDKYKLKLIFIIILIFIFSCLSIIILTTNFVKNDNIAYANGLSVTVTFSIASICIIVWFITLILNFKKENFKKYLPLFVLLLLGTLVTIIQQNHPEILIVTFLESYVLLIMYFTIENPDVKMINELNIAKDQAVKANAAKTDFLSSMSHEIRTPLNAIVGFSQSLKEENLPSSAVEEVQDIIDSSDTLLDIVNGILDISKIEANKVEIVNSNYSFKKIFNELVALSKARLGESKPMDFRHKMDETIPETLYGDYARVKQVTLNLLTNAIKYTDEGYIDFKVNSMISGGVCRLIISVEDSGRGIKKESINKLFTKFERLVEKNTTIEGTGLGLAITKKLVELMNGKIIVQSIYGKGSRFTIVLDQKIITNSESTPVVEVDNQTLIAHDLSKKKVLIVDDNQLNLKVAARMLKPFNVISESVDSGFKCIDLIASGNTYDLIFMDDMMPKLNGTDTLNRLKENDAFKIPVVALTANAISGMKEKYLAAGFDDYLAKQIEKIELTQIIKKYLDK